jgi:CRISPR-associated protein Cas5d
VFDAILWKPGVRWQPDKVELLEPPRYIALRRNEVKDKGPSERTIAGWISGRSQPTPLFADDDSSRTQRQTMALKRVRYRVQAHLVSLPDGREDLRVLSEQFARRARRGQCVWQPCMGNREFPAFFRLVEGGETPSPPVPIDLDIGWMVYDVFDLSRVNGDDARPSISLFRARIDQGVLDIPDYHSAEVVKPQPV